MELREIGRGPSKLTCEAGMATQGQTDWGKTTNMIAKLVDEPKLAANGDHEEADGIVGL